MYAKLKTFWYVFFKSISEPAYYNHVIAVKLWFSVKYFLFFFLFLSLLNTIQFTLFTLPKTFEFLSSSLAQLDHNYPQDLILTFSQNQLSVEGSDQPIHIPMPSQLQSVVNSQHQFDSLLTIDPSLDSAAPKSFITLTKKHLIIKQQTGQKESLPYSSFISSEYSLDKNSFTLLTHTTQTTLSTVYPFIPIIFFITAVIITPLSSLLLLFFYTLFTYTVATFLGKKLTYRKSFQLGLHTITFAETAGFLQNTLFVNPNLPSIYSLAFFGSTLLAISTLKPKRA